MPSSTQQQRTLLYAVDIAKRWVGTDVVREALIRGMRPDGLHGVFLAELAPLDAHPADDRTALEDWLDHWLERFRRRPDPDLEDLLFVPLRWRNHYSALLISGDAQIPAVLFDPHEDAVPRVHAPFPRSILRARLPTLMVRRPIDGPSQREPADTFCVVWMTMFLCDRYGPGMRLAAVWDFLREAVSVERADFFAFCRELGHPATRAGRLHRALRTASVDAYRTAFDNPRA